ncbi:putative membrane protein [Bisgaardia hudsonensis]|uniref:Putative membrane protein n=1 Tax=Bisgaardia hudsonensis TaxID=109472 RepID=A0A4R2MZV6_9PAST|nr:DUF2254 family protein [Bisgaardia hudsonensis]QLB13821.1 hypothetical protein A6A11_09470 [Bisgaardia hudsonensis]TCP11695.1 putative membrane protein [Bisgaardia hudsonensis]
MMYRLLLILKKPSNKLWVTPTYSAIFAVFFAFAARLAGIFLPQDILPLIKLSTLDDLLAIIASSMLAVSTFSLSIMVSAFSSAANSVTPRATDVLMNDGATRQAIASFISAFIYAIIAKTALGTGFYEQNGKFVLFISTIIVLVYLIVTLIRWVSTLSQLGRLSNTLDKIQNIVQQSLTHYREEPNMGATWKAQLTGNITPIISDKNGYLTHIDMASLQRYAEDEETYIHILVRPGDFIMPHTVLAYLQDKPENTEKITNSFIVERERNFSQDPNWGFIVLSEAAQRALSPAINDPGTAMRVMTGIMSILADAKPDPEDIGQKDYNRLSIIPLKTKNLIFDSFSPISRDGSSILEINLVMLKVLSGIYHLPIEPEICSAAKSMAEQLLERANQNMTFKPDIVKLQKKYNELFDTTK